MVLVKSWKSWLLSVPFWLILFLSYRLRTYPASLAPLEIKNHASAMYWFKPLTFACHRIPEKNGHIKVITSAYATLTCPFSPGMG